MFHRSICSTNGERSLSKRRASRECHSVLQVNHIEGSARSGKNSLRSSRAMHCSTNDLMTASLERSRRALTNSSHAERGGSLVFTSRSNEHSPKHQTLSLTPTNSSKYEQSKTINSRECEVIVFSPLVFSYRSYPYLSSSTNGADSTIVATTPVDPSVTNLGLLSPSSISSNSITDPQEQFKKSTSMRFAKLMEHPSK